MRERKKWIRPEIKRFASAQEARAYYQSRLGAEELASLEAVLKG